MSPIDQGTLDFDPASLVLLNIILGLIMFGIALDLRVADFRRVAEHPWAALVILTAQLLLLPALTFGLTLVLAPEPSIALGMILIAACPGGNTSNLITHLARGNTGLSISLTATCTAAAAVLTPVNLALWASLNPNTAALLQEVRLDPVNLLVTITVLLAFPLALGMVVTEKWPKVAAKLRRPFRVFSVLCLVLFIVAALSRNFGVLLDYLDVLFPVVLVHNTSALALGYVVARAARLAPADRRTATIEVGIQNSGLGLILIFGFFDGLGGMAYTAGLWGIWHLIAGGLLAWVWSRRPPVAATAG